MSKNKMDRHMTADDCAFYTDSLGYTVSLSAGCAKVSDGDRFVEFYYRGCRIGRDDSLRGYYGHYTTGGGRTTRGFEKLSEAKTAIDTQLDNN